MDIPETISLEQLIVQSKPSEDCAHCLNLFNGSPSSATLFIYITNTSFLLLNHNPCELRRKNIVRNRRESFPTVPDNVKC